MTTHLETGFLLKQANFAADLVTIITRNVYKYWYQLFQPIEATY